MFSMFFGAGNSVFPLAIGQITQSYYGYAFIGLFITGICVPFLGLFVMMLFQGNYHTFFQRTGKIPGFLVASAILALIGPFGATPRCITLSYATLQNYLPSIHLPVFSALACGIIFLLTFRKNKLMDVLGYYLTPILLGTIAIIICKGLVTGGTIPPSTISKGSAFFHGLQEGYQTMDLMGAFFFSSVIIACLQGTQVPKTQQEGKDFSFLPLAIRSSLIGATLLGLTYFGFSYLAAVHSELLADVAKDGLLGTVALHMLGSIGGTLASVAISFACLTTAIALTTVSAEFLQKELTFDRLSYPISLIIVLLVTFFVSTLHFDGISRILLPILQICYPALIVLSLMNLLHKFYGYEQVKLPVTLVFFFSFFHYLLG